MSVAKTRSRFSGETIWIIGASSGIGEQLAIALAQQGARLLLSARRQQHLAILRQRLTEDSSGHGSGDVPGKQVSHYIYPLDVANRQQFAETCAAVACRVKEQRAKLDRVIFLPALYQPRRIIDVDLDLAAQIVDVNFKSVLYLGKYLLPILLEQQSGQLALCGSVAGYTGLPQGQPYSATKAALINFAESLHAEVPKGIDIKLINPGFVATPLTEKNHFAMPMIISPQQAASHIMHGLLRTSFEIAFPKRFTLLLRVLDLLPYRLKLWITGSMSVNPATTNPSSTQKPG